MEWWRTGSLQTPASVLKATADYRQEQDIIGQFIEDCIQPWPGRVMKALVLQKLWDQWALEQGIERRPHPRDFKARLEYGRLRVNGAQDTGYLNIGSKNPTG